MDLVQIDVEGQDFDVIQLLNFSQVQPHCINYDGMIWQPREEEAERFFERKDIRYEKVPWIHWRVES